MKPGAEAGVEAGVEAGDIPLKLSSSMLSSGAFY